jgi:hypothetical protein
MTIPQLFLSLLLFSALVALSSYCGLLASRFFPWRQSVRINILRLSFGLALAPFFAGLLAIAALKLFPGASHFVHALFVFLILALLAATLRYLDGRRSPRAIETISFSILFSGRSQFLLVIFSLWLLSLVFNSLFLPLIQNDSLEYMIVARDIFDARSLANYPAIDTSTRSGFFGPWTHAPLYVSLIYLVSIFQGNAEIPFAARLLAPWFGLSAVAIVFGAGAIRSSVVALLASLLFVGAPLFFLGADSALMDSLPIAGLLLSFAVLSGCDLKHTAKIGFFLGGMLGFALWTHSQAVIFPFIVLPIVCMFWIRDSVRLQDLGKGVGSAIGTLLFVGGWPYLHNYRMFGSFISDNPAVFAIRELDWSGYFSMARGIHSLTEKIQYGLFKGLFATESYGLVFWMALPPVVYFVIKLFRNAGHWRSKVLHQNAFVVSIGMLGIYHAGALASILIGSDLMIKNERYFLVILGPASILAAGTLSSVFRLLNTKARVIRFGVLCFLVVQFVGVQFVYRLRPYLFVAEDQKGWATSSKKGDGWFEQTYWKLLLRWPSMRLIDNLNQEKGKFDLVLTFRPADFFYANIKMVSFLDPRIVPLYSLRDASELSAGLSALGITAIHVPDYFIPPINKSAIMTLLGRPDLARLIASQDGSQIYQLRSRGQKDDTEFVSSVAFGRESIEWTDNWVFNIGGRKSISSLTADDMQKADGDRLNLFHREISNFTFNGDGIFSRPKSSMGLVLIPSKAEQVRLELDLIGSGFVKFWLLQFDELGAPIRRPAPQSNYRVRIGEIAVRDSASFVRRVTVDPRARYLRVAIEYNGTYSVEVKRAEAFFSRTVARASD